MAVGGSIGQGMRNITNTAQTRSQFMTMLSSFLQPGAFDPGGAGHNFFMNSPLQRQGLGIEQFLAQPSPEMRTYDTARPILEGMLTGSGPQFEHDIAMANQQGGRFSSGNAIMRGEALRHLFNARTQTAGTLGMLSGQAGQSQWDRQFAAENMRLQLLTSLFGLTGQAVAPQQQPAQGNGMMDFLKILAGAAAFV